MAILMPARTGIELYEDALADAGIPYRHEGSRDFYQRQEVRDLIWVLARDRRPDRPRRAVGALRSSAFAINDEELVRHRAEAGSLSYRSKTEGPSAAVNEALAELRRPAPHAHPVLARRDSSAGSSSGPGWSSSRSPAPTATRAPRTCSRSSTRRACSPPPAAAGCGRSSATCATRSSRSRSRSRRPSPRRPTTSCGS